MRTGSLFADELCAIRTSVYLLPWFSAWPESATEADSEQKMAVNGVSGSALSLMVVDSVDRETQYDFQWNDKQRETIELYKKYFAEMLGFVKDLESNGPHDGKILPTKPKKELKSLLKPEGKENRKLFGRRLHEYLKKHIVGTKENYFYSLKEAEDHNPFKTLKDALGYLKSNYEVLKQSNNKTVHRSLQYGDWLNRAFQFYEKEKLAGTIKRTWEDLLSKEIKIDDSYARKLRAVARVLSGYDRFKRIGLPFNELHKYLKEIQNMLDTDSEVAEFGKQTN